MTNTHKAPADARIADFEQAIDVRLYQTEAVTPCQTVDPRLSPSGRDLWFSPFKDKIHAVRACQQCPFIGRCGYNAVAGRETHGVWGGISLPGIHGHIEELEAAYVVLLRQFKRRMPIELPGLQAPPMPSTSVRRRRNGDPAAA
ncbi:WhiB family transcriptional regulator [Mycolicibacterium septicum]|uniref:WhiB family transcriptional regulator n=1 Tax=Mycolicibacterium septicum TaxID=98668 RepID=UPI0023619AD2|nr:WhiB family transcriptional regulator [Mycolicibacterium septicum]